jgi:hypothetical protein
MSTALAACGVLSLSPLVAMSSCATDPAVRGEPDPEPVPPAVSDEPAPAPEFTERPSLPVATQPIPPDPTVGPTTPTTPTPTTPNAAVDPIQVTIFNRFLMKPKQQDMPESEIKAVVEDTVGAKVIRLRRTAVRFWLVQLEPSSPPRTAKEQKEIIAKLQGCGAFEIVEGDQLMTIK